MEICPYRGLAVTMGQATVDTERKPEIYTLKVCRKLAS
jgi:hypothetical protein